MLIFGFYDKVAKKLRGMTIAENRGLAIRENAKGLAQVYPLADIEIREMGEVDENEGTITEIYEARDVDKIVNWNEYEYPESPFKKVDKKE